MEEINNKVILESNLSEGQLGLWLIQNKEPSSTAYNTFFSVKFNNDIEIDKLFEFSKWLSKKHPILCTTFSETPESVKMKLNPDSNIHFEVLHLENSEEVKKKFEDEVNTAINLKAGPISKIYLAVTRSYEKYMLLLSHHIILDYWSLILVLKEMQDFLGNESFEHEMIEPEYGYFDSVKRQQEFRNDAKFQNSIEYWEQVLKDSVPSLKPPYGIVPRPDQKAQVKTESIIINEEITNRFYDRCLKLGVTPFAFLLANYHITLSYYFGENDIVTGVPFLGRYSKKELNNVGYYVNTLPIREKVIDSAIFSEYAVSINKRIKKAFSNQKVTLHKVQEIMNAKDLNQSNNCYQTMFILEKANIKSLEGASLLTMGMNEVNVELGDYNVSGFPLKNRDQLCDITIMLERFQDKIIGNVQYREDLYPVNFVKSFIEFFINCIIKTSEEPEIEIGSLKHPICCEQEIITVKNMQDSESQLAGSVAEQFEEVIQKFGSRIAVKQEKLSESYHELGKITAAIAELIMHKCGQEKKRYVIFCKNKINTLHGIIGVVRTGGSYIALDYSLPNQRIAEIIAQLNPAGIVFDTDSKGKLEEIEVEQSIAKISVESAEVKDKDNVCLSQNVYADDELYCIYTSGTSGKPKGLSVANKGVLRIVNNPNYCRITENNIIAQANNTSFDASVFEIWGAMLNGATLVLIDKFSLLNPKELRKIITNEKIDLMIVTTSLFNQLSLMVPIPFEGIKQLMFGGESANLHCVSEAYRKLPECRLVNMYGPSESTVFTTFKEISENCINNKKITIGSPVSDTVVHIRNTYDGSDLPLGVVGEIIIGGPGVAKGYVANEEETEKKFHVNCDGERVYCSGDLAYRDSNGEIVFCGRKDLQVKIRGFRVELSEIKESIDAIDLVQDSYVTTVENEFGTKQIAAYIKIGEESSKNISIHHIRECLSQSLPFYMVPAYITFVEKFNFSSSNKIDPSTLPKINFEGNIILPETKTEKMVYQLWQEMLDVETISCDTSFFEAGGHSLMAMQMKMRLEKMFDVEIALEKVYSLKTIKDIASYIDQLQSQPKNHQKKVSMKRVERRIIKGE
nr:AMP-binding protein [uncultured Lachnoclostridium sp.]